MKSAVIVFPGSNCDRDAISAIESISGKRPQAIWHAETSLPELDLVVLPGGFSYGDYLRCGAMAAHSPILQAIRAHAAKGRLVLGICNGFQILVETGLLPGVLLPNSGLKFICKNVTLKVESTQSAFTSSYTKGQLVTFPIAHHDGNYFADTKTIQQLEDNGRVAFRYVNSQGVASSEANPNGSAHNIAGIFNASRNILGLMPHPERHVESLTGSTDGRILFESVLHNLQPA